MLIPLPVKAVVNCGHNQSLFDAKGRKILFDTSMTIDFFNLAEIMNSSGFPEPPLKQVSCDHDLRELLDDSRKLMFAMSSQLDVLCETETNTSYSTKRLLPKIKAALDK